ncbi:hypothetical protein J3D60_001445 [Pseudomonas sp. S3E17]|nr:hypothetical protein [Pseudomonas sp. S3E17]
MLIGVAMAIRIILTSPQATAKPGMTMIGDHSR